MPVKSKTRGPKVVPSYTDAELIKVATAYVRSASKIAVQHHAIEAVFSELLGERKKGKRSLDAKVERLKNETRSARQAKEFLIKHKDFSPSIREIESLERNLELDENPEEFYLRDSRPF